MAPDARSARIVALVSAAAFAAGCGNITFGAAQTAPDAGVVVDAGDLPDVVTAPPDAGTPDTGPAQPGDVGCLEISTPSPVNVWPFPSDKDDYVAFFYEAAPGGSPGCSACHSVDSVPPLIPRDSELEVPGKFPRAVNELFLTVRAGGQARPTLLQSAHFDGGENRGDYAYTQDESVWLARFIDLLGECRWVDTYARIAVDGPTCMPLQGAASDAGEPDTGVAPDTGAADAGVGDDAGAGIDAGAGDAGEAADAEPEPPPDAGPAPASEVCECPLPPRDLNHCAM